MDSVARTRPPLVPMGLWTDEIRSHLGVAKTGQAMDALGALLGLWFVVDAWGRRRERRALVNLALGSVMVYVHAARFFEAKNFDACDLCARATI